MLRKFFQWFSRLEPRRCDEAHCWLPANKKLKGHHFCETHYHSYTYDIGITGKTL